jgi:phytoene synthase
LAEAGLHAAPLSVFRALERQQAHALTRRALRASEPLHVLQNLPAGGGPGTVWQAWRAARAWRRHLD